MIANMRTAKSKMIGSKSKLSINETEEKLCDRTKWIRRQTLYFKSKTRNSTRHRQKHFVKCLSLSVTSDERGRITRSSDTIMFDIIVTTAID